ncbi:hypothetical protein C0995_014491 [Termitomyces sp. Mi166|nr:hypothetical protein C0995_014491 [Termitomyces sp. Mi166\
MSASDALNASKGPLITSQSLLVAEYLDESHIQAFANALGADEFSYETQDVLSPTIPGTPVSPTPVPPMRIHKVSALSDFAPVNLRVKSFYVVIRQLVNAKEWITAWPRKTIRLGYPFWILDDALTQGSQEWKEAAVILDEYLHFHEWKSIDEDPFYDWKLVRKTLRDKKDARGCLERAAYFNELEKALEFICETSDLSIDEKKRFFKSANTNLGKFHPNHIGVVKAFLDGNLLPRVVTGTSAGGLIAALVCTRTDEELKYLLVPELANRITACEEPYTVWMKRLWKTGARFDSVLWARKCTFFTRGSMTFKEAYVRTGRILNISVIPADRHSPTKLLNYLTAPDTLIWTALLASAAVPGILNPVVLLQKLKDGSVVPWNWGSKFKDGSLSPRVDIPLQALNLYFNVTNPVVSQVNPHVHLFFFAPRGSAGKPVAHRKGKGWRGNFLFSAAEQWLKHELSKNFKVIRDLELLPQLLGQDWSGVFLQKFEGAVTSNRARTNDESGSKCYMAETLSKLHMIENRAKIEKQIYLGRQYVRKALRGRAVVPESPSFLFSTTANIQDPIQKPRIPSLSIGPSQPSSDLPMSVDTDAETAFRRGSHWFFKKGRDYEPIPTISGSVTPARDIARTSMLRRVRTPENPDITQNGSSSSPVQADLPFHPLCNSKSMSMRFLSRLRARSFPNLTSPLAADSNPSSKNSAETAGYWSSDSSSDDELAIEDRRQLRYPSTVDLGPLDPNSGDV